MHIPNIMPKPDLTALTGGYRKTPVLQIGADIYCDTALIADVLEERGYPTRPCIPAASQAASRILAQWADSTLFWTAIPFAMQPAGLAHVFEGMPPEAIKAFADDRVVFRANMPRMRPADANAAFALYLERLEETLGKQTFFFGAAPSIADFSIYHCLWFVVRGGPVAKILESFPALQSWRARMAAFGHGTHEKLDSGAAIGIAHDAAADEIGPEISIHTVLPSASGWSRRQPIPGRSDRGDVYMARPKPAFSIAREDPRAGQVVVHFPRLGFELRRVK